MKKRIISLALSAITAVSAVSAMNTNAVINYWGQLSEQVIEETFKDAVKLENQDWISIFQSEIMYMKSNDSYVVDIYELSKTNDNITLRIDTDDDISDLENMIKSIDETFIVSSSINPGNNKYINVFAEKITFETAKKIREIAGDRAISFWYKFNGYSYQNVIYHYLTGYPVIVGNYNDDNTYTTELTEEKLCNYVESHNEDLDLVMYSAGQNDIGGNAVDRDVIYIVPKSELTVMEHLALAEDIYEETGYKPYGLAPENINPSLGGSTIDLTNYLNGDANCDNIQSMADAASIFQAIGNPDKYSLSDLGQFNADFANDGLTPDDAIAIQKKLAGIAE